MSRRRVNPRDLPFAAEGGTYHVVNGALQTEPPPPAPEAVPAVAAPEATDAEPPSARTHGGRPSRSKE